MNDLDTLITDWLTLPDVAERLDVEVSRVRRLVEEGHLIAIRRGEPVVRMVPAQFLGEDGIIPHLAGTITILRDGGWSDAELLEWLFTEDPSLPGRPVDQLRRGQRGEVRRRALALAL
ncbi:Rv2175c family DNA-binding protein [Brachybacterium sp. AOP43-C2-M15]|uniref:Rv2175c family DNA-binding protein n=1 Tax=Brachybacterium sp. AOP43-C2-M15 TaxID=3457661 RepID=UPI004034C41D